MLSLYGRDDIVRNVYRVARVESPASAIATVDDLRQAYLHFLEIRQPSSPVNRGPNAFINNVETEDRLSNAFSMGALNDLNQEEVVGQAYSSDLFVRKARFASEALDHVLSLNEDLAFIFELVIHSIFVRPSKATKGMRGSHGGSTSGAIGAIWLSVGDVVGQRDLMEMYVHELTHHLLFIDELNEPQFNYRAIAKQENFALSAILRRKGHLDKVVHSIVVGAELIAARQQYLNDHRQTVMHPETTKLQSDTLSAIRSVFELSNFSDLITPHMLEVVERCSDVCQHGYVH